MKDLILYGGALACLYLAVGGTLPIDLLAAPVAPVAPDVGPAIDVTAAFTANADAASRAADCALVAGMLDGLADAIETDGKRSAPKFTYAAQLLELRDAAIAYAFRDQKMATKYPNFWPSVKSHFEFLSDGTKPLDAGSRAQAVDLFRQLARGCRKAA